MKRGSPNKSVVTEKDVCDMKRAKYADLSTNVKQKKNRLYKLRRISARRVVMCSGTKQQKSEDFASVMTMKELANNMFDNLWSLSEFVKRAKGNPWMRSWTMKRGGAWIVNILRTSCEVKNIPQLVFILDFKKFVKIPGKEGLKLVNCGNYRIARNSIQQQKNSEVFKDVSYVGELHIHGFLEYLNRNKKKDSN